MAERGFAFLKDPLFLASSVFVKRTERIMALAFIMTLCLLVYKLAELRVRQRLAATGQTVPDQVCKPTASVRRCAGSFSVSRASICIILAIPTASTRPRSCVSPWSTAWSYTCSDPPTKTPIWSSQNPGTEIGPFAMWSGGNDSSLHMWHTAY